MDMMISLVPKKDMMISTSSMAPETSPARKHVEEIRRTKFSIGGKPNPLTEDLHQAVKNLSAELYAKDVHFLMELIQNAEDNEYPADVVPSLEFVITSKDITNTGAPATLLVFNNEKGFLRKNIESICSVGRSTKKGMRKRGYIGEKGIGFKSVFLITAQPYIFSNGYQIRFNEKPCHHCNVSYIVPEWVVNEKSMLSAIQSVYGSSTPLPTTTLVLPLKQEKVKAVKDQLSSVHPEVLLFLSKIRRLSVREVNQNPNLNSVTAISISSEKNFATSKGMDADSYTLHLTAAGNGECGYYMWKQRFPVKQENKVDVRREVDEWVITLAFPHGERLKRGRQSSSPGIYSFLPTETVTNFPFIIQADFLLASSRENILWDNKWNQGILDCVPVAFVNAFTALLKSTEAAPISSLPNMFLFLPVNTSSYIKLNNVRDALKAKLMNEMIVPCESYNTQPQKKKLFCKPNEVGRLKPTFWCILNKAKKQGVSFSKMSSHGAYLLASSFDKSEYNTILNFLGITHVDSEWYVKCIEGSNLVKGVSEDVYIQLLVFIAENWGSLFSKTNIKNTPLIKYVGLDRKVDLVAPISGTNKLLAADSEKSISWLLNWNTEFGCSTNTFFLPKVTQEAILSCARKPILVNWLKERANVDYVGVYEYAAQLLLSSVNSDRKLAVTYAHFLYTSSKNDYLMEHQIKDLCSKIPIVDNYGQVKKKASVVLVPAKGSRWVELIGSYHWELHNYIEMGEDYTRRVTYFGNVISSKELVPFLQMYVGASDVPHLYPPNAAIPTLSSPLTKKNSFLLLDWLRFLRASGIYLPEMFLYSIQNGSWLKISLGSSRGYRPPSESFVLDSSIGNLLQNGSLLVEIPLIDKKFYGEEINNYKDELRTIGVKFENAEACEYIGNRLMSLAASSDLTKDNVISILKFIKYLRANYISPGEFIRSIRGKKWVKTSQGYMTPNNSVLFSQEWNAVSQISDIPFIDQSYYGNELLSFKEELGLLGVAVKFNKSYQLVVDNVKSSSSLASLSSEAMLLALTCIKSLESANKLVQAMQNTKCLKTNLGYTRPSECFLLNPKSPWGGLLQVFGSFSFLDEKFYGNSIFSMSDELKKIGVMVDFEDASKEFTRIFKQQASLRSIKKEHVISFLQCYRKLKKLDIKFPDDFQNCICKEKWIRTRLDDYRSPNECILFGKDWEPFSPICRLPFIDDNYYDNVIHTYRVELKGLGVVTDYKDGAKFVANGIFLPEDSSSLTPASVYALLESVKKLKEKETEEIPAIYREKLSQKQWLKTYFGYKRPDDCLLFDSSRDSLLKRNDGPFIDEGFYGPQIESYRKELNVLGVITDTKKECQLLSRYLNFHTNFETISRIYNYLAKYKWQPADEDRKMIWTPKGKWLMPQDCVLHDNNNLFGEQMNVLESCKYDDEILGFFAKTFNVKVHPSVDDYCKLWKTWEASGRQITHDECCAFWEFVVRNWYPRAEDTFKNNLLKLPVLDPNSNRIILVDKHNIFIGDDLFLTDLFQSCSRTIFVWFPQPSLKSLTRTKLVDIYTKLGVRTLSESAQKNTSDVNHAGFEPVNSKEKIIKKGLIKLILAFLADPKLEIEPDKRHEAVSRLLAIEAFETPEKMSVRYRLSLSSGEVVDVEPRRMVRWDKQNSKLYMQKMDRSSGQKYVMEYAFHFAEEIAEGVLWENEELVPELSEMIRSCFLVEFDEEAVEFFMKKKNLQIFVEDQNYLSSIFSSSKGNLQEISWAGPSSGQQPTSRPKKRRVGNDDSVTSYSSSYELRSTKSQKGRDSVSVTPVTIIIPD